MRQRGGRQTAGGRGRAAQCGPCTLAPGTHRAVVGVAGVALAIVVGAGVTLQAEEKRSEWS